MADRSRARRVLAERLTAQLLAGSPAPGPVAVAGRLLAVQGQDPRGFRLAVRARTARSTASAVDRALTVERSLVVAWVNRGTLHLVRSEDHAWLLALTAAPRLTATLRRLADEGITPAAADRGVATIERALAAEGPLTRAALRERLAARGIEGGAQVAYHLLGLACLRGVAVRGPMAGGEQAYALVRDWIGPPPRVDRAVALAELARRYLRGHGPAGERDLARWAGVPLRDARAGLGSIASELSERDGLVYLKRRTATAPLPPPRLLGAFDPVLLGWVSRAPIVGTGDTAVAVGGLFRPFAMVRGRAVATWRLAGGRVAIEPLERIGPRIAGALARDGEDVVRFLES